MAIHASDARDTTSAVRRLPLLPTALRFGAVGLGGVAVNLLSLHALYGLARLPLLVATTVSVELAIVNNYVLNDRWTFRAHRPSWSRFARFNLAALATLLANVFIVWLLVGAGAPYLWADVVGIGAGAALNFGVSSAWVWRGGTR